MAIKPNDLNKELNAMKKWINYLNEDNRIGVGHFPNDERSPDYRESCGEGSELGNQPDSEMSGYMSEVEDNEEHGHEEEIGDVKIGMAIMSHLNDLQMGVDDESRKKLNFIKAMVKILIDKGNTWVTDDELDGLYHQWMNK